MTARPARFEVVHTDAGHFARFVGANGRKVWQTEVYRKHSAAVRAVELIAGNPVEVTQWGPEVVLGRDLLEVRTVDERSKP